MNSATATDVSLLAPKKVIHLITIDSLFHYSPGMSIGSVKNLGNFKIGLIANRYFKFLVEKTSENRLSVICERHKTSNLNSELEEDALEADDGCFLRLYISLLGGFEKPKSAALRSCDTSASVEFTTPIFSGNYGLKCVVRRIENTILANEYVRKQRIHWQEFLVAACHSGREKEKMAVIMEISKVHDILTYRRTTFFDDVGRYIGRSYHFAEEIAQCFEAKKNHKPKPENVDLGLILGNIHYGINKAITFDHCIKFYETSHEEGLIFLKELCTMYIVENLTYNVVIKVFALADVYEDSLLFDTVWSYSLRDGRPFFESEKWEILSKNYTRVACSILWGFNLRLFQDCTGFPPSIEDESGLP